MLCLGLADGGDSGRGLRIALEGRTIKGELDIIRGGDSSNVFRDLGSSGQASRQSVFTVILGINLPAGLDEHPPLPKAHQHQRNTPMNQPTPFRRTLLKCLTMPMLLPMGRASAQGSTAPTQPSRAPFGLTWGMSVELVHEQLRVRDPDYTRPGLSQSHIDGTRWHWYVRFLRGFPVGAERVTLYFGHRNQLYEVFVQSQNMLKDTNAIARYRELSIVLSEVYGSGNETVAARRWFGRSEENIVLRETSFNTAYISVILSLNSRNHWSINYLNRARLNDFLQDRRRRERDTL